MLRRYGKRPAVPPRERWDSFAREAGRQMADRAQPMNESTGRAIKAAGAEGFEPAKQFELQNTLYGGRLAAIPNAVDENLTPIYRQMRADGLLDADGQPTELNHLRKALHDRELATLSGGARKSSAGIHTVADAQEAIDRQRTELGPDKFGKLERANEAVQQFVRDTRQMLVAPDETSAGLITQETADLLEELMPNYQHTIHAKYLNEATRPPTQGGGNAVTQNRNTLIRLAKEGGEGDTEPAMQSVIRQRAEVELAVRRNKVAYAAVETLLGDPEIAPWMERKKSIRMAAAPGGELEAIWREGDQKGAISRFVGGKHESWGLKDNAPEPVKRAWAVREQMIKAEDVPQAGLMAALFRNANKPLKWGATTLSVPFQLRNALRDSVNLFIQAGFRPIAELPSTFYATLSKSPEWRDMIREGGGFESFNIRAPRDLEEAIAQSGGLVINNAQDLQGIMARVWKAKLGMAPVTEAIEMAPRLAARRHMLRASRTPEEATAFARRVTVDWNRMGAAAKQVNPFVLFFNPRVQGTLNMGRILRDNRAARMRLAGLASAAVLAYLWNRQQPGYGDIPDYIKNQSMVFMLPGASPNDQGGYDNLKYVAIPLGEWSLFTAPINMLGEHWDGTDKRGLLDELGQLLETASPTPLPFSDPVNFGMQVLPAPVRSLAEANLNNRFYTGAPIVPRSMESLPRERQIAPYTSQGSIWAANTAARLGLPPQSPMVLDFMVKENLGGLGTMMLGMSDGLLGKAPDTLPVIGSIASGVYRTYGGQEQQDRYDFASKLQDDFEHAAVKTVEQLPEYQSAPPQTQRGMLVAATDELRRATQQAQGITPGTAPSQQGLPPKYVVPKGGASQREIDDGIRAVNAYMANPINGVMPSRPQLDLWAQYYNKVDPAYTAAVKARSAANDAARGAVTQIINNAPPPAVGSDAEALQRAGAIKAQLDTTARYVNARTGQPVGTPAQWDQWDQWLSRYNNLPAKDPQRPYLPNPIKLRYAASAQLLLSMQNQRRLRMSLEDPDYQRYYGLGKGLSEDAWQQIRSTPKYKDLPAGADQQAAARDAFLAAYRKLPPRDPRRLQFRLQALNYQRRLNPAYAQIVPTARFIEQYGVGDLSQVDVPAA